MSLKTAVLSSIILILIGKSLVVSKHSALRPDKRLLSRRNQSPTFLGLSPQLVTFQLKALLLDLAEVVAEVAVTWGLGDERGCIRDWNVL